MIIWLTDNLPNIPYRKEYPAHTEIEAFRALHEESVVVAPILLKSPLWAVPGPIVRAAESFSRERLSAGRRTAIRGTDRRAGGGSAR